MAFGRKHICLNLDKFEEVQWSLIMYDPNAYNDNGWNSNGYGGETGYDNNLSPSSSPLDAGDPAYNTDYITNPYTENPYENNVFDNAYTETFSNPNPGHDYSNNSGFELE